MMKANANPWMNPKLITHLTFHCAATPEGRDVSAKTICDWDIAKFGEISYHWVVLLDGTAVRTLRDSQRGAHTGGHNTGNIGVCYVGGMDARMAKSKDTRTPAQRARLRQVAHDYEQQYPNLIILGHRDWPGVRKDCPCFDVRTQL
jgi:N-acetyl-anhydromuramyl-L-alanine amidase AmpD